MPRPLITSPQSSDEEEESPQRSLVEGVIVDAKLLVVERKQGVAELESRAQQLALRLCYSNLQIGLFFAPADQDPEKENLVKGVGPWTKELVVLKQASTKESLEAAVAGWPVAPKSSVFVTANLGDNVLESLSQNGWSVVEVCPGSGDVKRRGVTAVIEQLQDIYSTLALLNKRVLGENLVVVAHVMKWSREKDFLLRGAFPLLSDDRKLSFQPIQLSRPLDMQLEAADVILQKVTDEISSVSADGALPINERVKFSRGIQELQRYIKENPHVTVIDPVERVLPLLDRSATQKLLEEVDSIPVPGNRVVRLPRSLEVLSLDDPGLLVALENAKVKPPTIVKPKIACGASEAHIMAVVLRDEGYCGLKVPVPASIQEYIDHGKLQYKMYVVGKQLFCSPRKSTPNAAAIAVSLGSEDAAIIFDSLKPFPANLQTEKQGGAEDKQKGVEELDLEAVRPIATWLRYRLGLTIIGFDVVVQAGSGDHVIVDVNFFPSFKDVADSEAVPAFWEAILRRHHLESLTKS